MKYKTERLTAQISVEKYLEEYVEIEEFLEYCKECRNYETKWSCPPYDFDVMEYWKQYSSLHLLGSKIIFDEEDTEKTYTKEELDKLTNEVLSLEKQKLADELYEMEKLSPGSVSLSAGSCGLCDEGMMNSPKCSRTSCGGDQHGGAKENCIHFDKMRYSIESLGGNVGKTCTGLLNTKLEWIQEGRLPEYFILVCGILEK